jgi:hypothetical protein
MKKKAGSQYAFSNRRVLLSIVASLGSLILGLLASGALSVFAQPLRTKSGANCNQPHLITASFPASAQNFGRKRMAHRAAMASH